MKRSKHQFIESQIKFNFGTSWKVVAFDKTKFYQRISGLGVKGVDFLAIQNNKLFFIEVKNFTQYKPIKAEHFVFEDFVEKIIIKFEDSQRVIRIIHKHYTEKWWYNLIEQLPPYFHKFKNRNFLFWEECFSILNTSESNLNFILWMEHDFDEITVDTKIQIPLTGYFTTPILVVNTKNSLLIDLVTIVPK